jgi:hypothetical protein
MGVLTLPAKPAACAFLTSIRCDPDIDQGLYYREHIFKGGNMGFSRRQDTNYSSGRRRDVAPNMPSDVVCLTLPETQHKVQTVLIEIVAQTAL